MTIELVETEIFSDYPEAQHFVDEQNAEGKACLLTNCNDGFVVDVYEEQPTV